MNTCKFDIWLDYERIGWNWNVTVTLAAETGNECKHSEICRGLFWIFCVVCCLHIKQVQCIIGVYFFVYLSFVLHLMIELLHMERMEKDKVESSLFFVTMECFVFSVNVIYWSCEIDIYFSNLMNKSPFTARTSRIDLISRLCCSNRNPKLFQHLKTWAESSMWFK